MKNLKEQFILEAFKQLRFINSQELKALENGDINKVNKLAGLANYIRNEIKVRQ